MSEEIKTLKFLTGIAVDPAVEITQTSSINDLTDVDTVLRPPLLNDKLFWNGEIWIPESGIEKGYIFGGEDSSGPSVFNDVDEYTIEDTWVGKNDYDGGAVSFVRATKISLLGYCVGEAGNDRALRSYNRAADSYSILTGGPANEGLRNAAIQNLNSSFYLFGGVASSPLPQSRATHEYNSINDVWTQRADMPLPGRSSAKSFGISNKAYLCYGNEGPFANDTINDVDEYDPDTWTSKADAPGDSKRLFAATHLGDKGHTFGGLTSGGVDGVNENNEYDPLLNSWASRAALPFLYRGNGAFTLAQGSRAYSMGGFLGQGDDTNEYVPDTWTTRAAIPAPQRTKFGSTEI